MVYNVMVATTHRHTTQTLTRMICTKCKQQLYWFGRIPKYIHATLSRLFERGLLALGIAQIWWRAHPLNHTHTHTSQLASWLNFDSLTQSTLFQSTCMHTLKLVNNHSQTTTRHPWTKLINNMLSTVILTARWHAAQKLIALNKMTCNLRATKH